MTTTPRRGAAFFDVDGTLVASTIVHYYVYFRRRRMSSLVGALWSVAFHLKCLYYLALDRIDRNWFNVAFYRSYRGLVADELRGWSEDCYRDVIAPRLFQEAAACIDEHRRAGRAIVLVTGSVDFIMAPLAKALSVDHVIAARLVERDGRFTGVLDGVPIGGEEKARRMRAFAEEQGIGLAQSYAYGDSIWDLPMLQAVGHPRAVNPDGKLSVVAREKGFSVHRWSAAVRE